jgi:hypothetical protein
MGGIKRGGSLSWDEKQSGDSLREAGGKENEDGKVQNQCMERKISRLIAVLRREIL